MRALFLSLICLSLAIAAEPVHPQLPFAFKDLKLVDQVDLGSKNPGHEYTTVPQNAGSIKNILGQSALELSNKAGSGVQYVAVRLGKDKGLVAGKGYVLAIEYPEDQPRGYIVRNHGAEITRGFHTGPTLGDGLEIPYVYSHPESINYPLSQSWKQWVSVFHLHDHFTDVKTPRGKGKRPFSPKDGFHVVVAHFAHKDAPLSKGLALGKISLYEAPDHKDISLDLVLPPKELPQRHLFYREEMADGVISKRDGAEAGIENSKDWFEYHARLMKYLGINTFSKDLLEFGANQGWSPAKYGGGKWMHHYGPADRYWSDIIDLAEQYDLNVLPYYEYCGTKGPNALGNEKRCRTLYQRKKGPKGRDDYTHISWTEPHNADVTDPDTYEDLQKILDCTITPYSSRVNIVGAWIRTRNSQLPISFSDRCLKLYASETGSDAITRQQLIDNKPLYDQYLKWWFGKRKDFLSAMRDYIRETGGTKDGVILFTADSSEGGTGIGNGGKGVVTDSPALWKNSGQITHDIQNVLDNKLAMHAQMELRGTWGGWEWQHSVPPADPQHYQDSEGVLMTYGFNRLYTVSSSEQTEVFSNKSGLAMVRHYVLNENALKIGKEYPLGYFVCDFDTAGPYHMLAEARALAYSDPKYLGYLASAVYSSGFTEYHRAFNQAFLSLPAIPSSILEDASSDKTVIVRSYPSEEHGTWFAVINTGLNDAKDVSITLPVKKAVDAISGEKISLKSGRTKVSLYPGQVLTWHSK